MCPFFLFFTMRLSNISWLHGNEASVINTDIMQSMMMMWARWLNGQSANLLTGRSMVPRLTTESRMFLSGLEQPAASQSSCLLLMAWQLGTERVVQLLVKFRSPESENVWGKQPSLGGDDIFSSFGNRVATH
ncbi:hypothetical protein T265_09514 [Opisthorchis viverrini]|uniref:Uncharacterized protein n=1 Tax=Opisthorchis viverrini TaxID=6198 RepID=A0A074Z9W9_OPIVI|nr:hypothetical protein T265_09514 [Opisthorchis viverrini]KER22372.1 hypothetical protein T265_09514 [Opisthorchis viverrini]